MMCDHSDWKFFVSPDAGIIKACLKCDAKEGENPLVISRLVDAAPDLLEACRMAYKMLSDLPAWAEGNFEELYYPELVLTLKAAIAKAEPPDKP
jgi:hypothetical protein